MCDARLLKIAEFLEGSPRDRRGIADHIGLGVTVTGEILKDMIRNKIVKKHGKAGTVGRHCDIFALCDDPVFAVITVIGEEIRSVLFGYSLKIVTSVSTEIRESLFFDDSFTEHLRLLRDASPNLICACFVADGTAADGCFTNAYPRQLTGLPVRDIFKIYFPDTELHLESSPLWDLIERDRLSAHLSDNGSDLRLSLIHGDTVLSVGGVGRNIGDVTDSLGRTLSSAVKFARNAEEYVTAMARAVETVLSFTAPTTLCISQKRYGASREIIRRIEEKMITDHGFALAELPEIVCPGDMGPVSSSLCRYVRNNAITNIIL